jgi:hypothetical protein
MASIPATSPSPAKSYGAMPILAAPLLRKLFDGIPSTDFVSKPSLVFVYPTDFFLRLLIIESVHSSFYLY